MIQSLIHTVARNFINKSSCCQQASALVKPSPFNAGHMESPMPPALSLSYLDAAWFNGRCVWSSFLPSSKGTVSPCSVYYMVASPQKAGALQGPASQSFLLCSQLNICCLQLQRVLVWSWVTWRWEVSDIFQELRNMHSSESATWMAEMNRKWTTKQLRGVGSRGAAAPAWRCRGYDGLRLLVKRRLRGLWSQCWPSIEHGVELALNVVVNVEVTLERESLKEMGLIFSAPW